MSTASLRAQLGSALINVGERVPTTLPTGISKLDVLTGGLPRGAITEVYGPPSTGRTSIAFAILAAATAQEEVCALMDGRDAFNPASAASAGIDLRQLLWIRCHDVDQVLRSTDLLLQGGGFGLAIMDFSDLPVNALRKIPLAVWFRFQRVIEKSPTVLLLIGNESIAKSAASLVLQTGDSHVDWRGNLLAGNELSIEIPRIRNSNSGIRNAKFSHHVSCYTRP
jgi:recombination protein RecA